MSTGIGLVIVLFIAGLIAILCEIFIPGGILGMIGVLLILASVISAFKNLGVNGGLIVLVIAAVIAPMTWFFGLGMFPKSPLGKYMTLKASARPEEGYRPLDFDLQELVGAEGVAVTMLRPSGIAEINKKRYQVVTQGEILDKETKIKVLKVEENEIVVRQA